MKPLVSIIIPTFRRVDLLPKAIDSALAQTYENIEVIVSDDEDPPGEAAAYLRERAAKEPRLRVSRNPGPHGQAPNTNNALKLARGEWIKPLHDDDRLLPNCISRFMEFCHGRDHIALAGCRAVEVRNGRRIEPKTGTAPPAELIRQPYVHLGMYLFDDVVTGPPTTMFINRRAVESGGVMRVDSVIRYFADSVWTVEILRHGDSAVINEGLVEYVQDDHVSLSTEYRLRADDLDAELLQLREIIYHAIPHGVDRPPLETSRQMVLALRLLSQLKARHVWPALRRVPRVRRPTAWWKAVRYLLRQRFPGAFHETPRELLPPVAAADSPSSGAN